jgi:hypothetical protein
MSQHEFVTERRRFNRFEVELSSDNLDMDTGLGSHCTTRDVSKKGIGLVLPRELPQGANLVICLSGFHNSQEIVRRQAKVVWSKKYGPNRFRSGVELQRQDIPISPGDA